LDDGIETEHFGIHFEGGDGTRGNDDGREAVKYGFDSNGGIKAGEVKDGVWGCGGIGFEGLEDEEKALVVCCCKGGKCSYFLKGLVVFYVGELEGSDKRSQPLGAEPVSCEQDFEHVNRGNYLSGFFSMKVYSLRCCRKEGGVSDITCSTFIRVCRRLRSAIPDAGLHIPSYLEILHESLQEYDEMFCSPYVPRHSFLKKVIWQS